jgi:uncharacterized glyoxalase superfamily protein PhnB
MRAIPAVLLNVLLAAVLAGAGVAAASNAPRVNKSQENKEERKPMVKKVTAVLFVPEVEPCAKFWTDKFGFQKLAEVPEGDKLGFVMLQKGNVELMYQSYASADKDSPATGAVARKGPTFLYIEVDDLEAIKATVKGAEVTMPERTTFYGSREIGIKDPGGHYLTFAQFAPSAH